MSDSNDWYLDDSVRVLKRSPVECALKDLFSEINLFLDKYGEDISEKEYRYCYTLFDELGKLIDILEKD